MFSAEQNSHVFTSWRRQLLAWLSPAALKKRINEWINLFSLAGKGGLSDFWLEHWLSVNLIFKSFSISHAVKSRVLNDITLTSPFPVSHVVPLIVCISFVQMSTLPIGGASLVRDWWWLMCFGTLYLFIIHELAFLPGFICGQSLQLCKSMRHLSSRDLCWPEILTVKDELRSSRLVLRCEVCITVGQGKGACGGDVVCDFANLLEFEFVPSPDGIVVKVRDRNGCKQCAAGLRFLMDVSVGCFICKLHTRRLSSEGNSAFQSPFLPLFSL